MATATATQSPRRRSAAAAVRRDPKPRHVDAQSPWARLINQDPNKHYVLVYENGGDIGPDYYEGIGYEVVKQEPDGVRLAGARSIRIGEPIRTRGAVLMSCSKEHREQIEQFGPDGDSGQDYADQIEEKIINKAGIQADLFRGLSGMTGRNYVRLKNETRAPEIEELEE